MASEARRIVVASVLAGEPTDGTGRACIHLFVPDGRGPIVEPHALHPLLDTAGQPIKQQVVARPTRGRLACNPRRGAAPVVRGGVTTVTARTDDARAATCPRCLASVDHAEAMRRLAETAH